MEVGTKRTLGLDRSCAPRHFIPTHSSWLNQVEGWFSILTTKQIKRGSHKSVEQLKTAIDEFLDAWNENPTPFKWTKSAERILANVARSCSLLYKLTAAPKEFPWRTEDPPH